MAQLIDGMFDANKVDPTQGGGSLPIGRHVVVAIASEIKANKENTGGMLIYTLQIIDGPHKGQQGPYRLNLYNNSAQAVEIARKQFSAMCHVTGVYQVNDSAQLHNIPFMIDVALQKDPDAAAKGYTEITRVYDRNGNEPGRQGQQQPPAQTTQGAPAQSGWGGQQQQPQQQQPPAAQQTPPAGQGGWGGQQQQTPPASQGAGWTQGNSQQIPGNGNPPAASGGNTPPWAQPKQ